MAEFREPKRGTSGGFVSYLYLDGNQVVNSLSAIEGGYIDKITSKSVEEANKDLGITGELGVSGARAVRERKAALPKTESSAPSTPRGSRATRQLRTSR